MTEPFITINKGGPTEDIEDGVYAVTLVDIKGPKIVTANRGPNAGKEIALLDWELAVDEGDAEGYEITAVTSTASGPKSKMFTYLTALFGGKAPPVGTQLAKEQILGRRALATIAHNDGGWPIVANLGAIPGTMPRAAATPTNGEAMVPRPTVNQRAARQARAMADAATITDADGTRPLMPAGAAKPADDLPF